MAGSPASAGLGLPMIDPEELRAMIDGLPDYQSYMLQHNNGSMKTTVMPEAWKGSGRTPEEPGSAKQYYFEEHELLVVDLSKP